MLKLTWELHMYCRLYIINTNVIRIVFHFEKNRVRGVSRMDIFILTNNEPLKSDDQQAEPLHVSVWFFLPPPDNVYEWKGVAVSCTVHSN